MIPIKIIQQKSCRNVKRESGFRLNKSKPKSFKYKISKILWNIIKKLGFLTEVFQMEKIWEYGEIEQKKVTELVITAINSFYERDINLDDYIILIGAKQFSEIMRDTSFNDFNITLSSGPIKNSRYKFRNIPLHIISYMDGVIIIPRDIIK